VKETVEKVTEQAQAAPADNSLDATSLIGTVVKSIFGGIGDFLKGLVGGKK